ncbi:hypothetical protein P4S70_17985 [Enterovibrio sp. Hal110]
MLIRKSHEFNGSVNRYIANTGEREMTQRLALFAFLLTASPMLMAHAGHDHGHWSASLIHLLWALPVIVAGAIAFWGYAVYVIKSIINKESKHAIRPIK